MDDQKIEEQKSKKVKKQNDDTQIELLHQQIQELDNNYKRALADYQNLLKQTAKEREDYLKYTNATLLVNFLPILDHVEQAYKHLNDPGLQMIVKQFKQLLTDEGLREINPAPGMPFSEHEHECIDIVEGAPDQQDHVAEVSQIGYKYPDGQVLRHAKVRVFKSPDQESESA